MQGKGESTHHLPKALMSAALCASGNELGLCLWIHSTSVDCVCVVGGWVGVCVCEGVGGCGWVGRWVWVGVRIFVCAR